MVSFSVSWFKNYQNSATKKKSIEEISDMVSNFFYLTMLNILNFLLLNIKGRQRKRGMSKQFNKQKQIFCRNLSV